MKALFLGLVYKLGYITVYGFGWLLLGGVAVWFIPWLGVMALFVSLALHVADVIITDIHLRKARKDRGI